MTEEAEPLTPIGPPPAAVLDAAQAMGLVFEDGDVERLAAFLDRLRDENRRMNLTRIVDDDAAWERHILDSLSLVPVLAGEAAQRVIDVGSGGGLPGIPLAIVMSDVQFTLLEATGKKAAFLERTARALGLDNVTVVNDRAENAGRDRECHREQYDAVIARAVGPLPVLLELTVPLARVGGLVIAIKGERAAEEIAAARSALHALHATVAGTQRTTTGTLVIIEKRRITPKIYPRKPGEPKRVPL